MKTTDRNTLKRVFTKPAPTDIPWNDIESMLRGVGVKVMEQSGSWIAIVKDAEVMVLRRPHPKPVTLRATVRDIAAFFGAVGVKP